MSIFSDYKVGAMSDFEYEEACKRMNRIERYDREHEYEMSEEEIEEEAGRDSGFDERDFYKA